MSTSALKQAAFWVPWAAITYMAVTPTEGPPLVTLSDKLLHALAFSYLTGAMWLAYRDRLAMLAMAAVLMAYGLAIELVQLFVPTRYFSLLDLAADAAGITGALLAIVIASKLQERGTDGLARAQDGMRKGEGEVRDR